MKTEIAKFIRWYCVEELFCVSFKNNSCQNWDSCVIELPILLCPPTADLYELIFFGKDDDFYIFKWFLLKYYMTVCIKILSSVFQKQILFDMLLAILISFVWLFIKIHILESPFGALLQFVHCLNISIWAFLWQIG